MRDIIESTTVDTQPTKKASHRRTLLVAAPPSHRTRRRRHRWIRLFRPGSLAGLGPPAAALAAVTVSNPVQRDVETRLNAVGQFSAINRIELRAQVGGTLSEIHFEDGQIVRKGDLLFVIDPRPYEIKLTQANAALDAAKSRYSLATIQLERSQALLRTGNSTREIYDQRAAEQQAAQAAIDDAQSRSVTRSSIWNTPR